MAEKDTWKRLENSRNAMNLVEEFKKKIREEEIRVYIRKEKVKENTLNPKAQMFKRSELLEKYTVNILFEQDDRKFEKVREKLCEIERKMKVSSFKDKILGGYCHGILKLLYFIFILFYFILIYFLQFLFLFF